MFTRHQVITPSAVAPTFLLLLLLLLLLRLLQLHTSNIWRGDARGSEEDPAHAPCPGERVPQTNAGALARSPEISESLISCTGRWRRSDRTDPTPRRR